LPFLASKPLSVYSFLAKGGASVEQREKELRETVQADIEGCGLILTVLLVLLFCYGYSFV